MAGQMPGLRPDGRPGPPEGYPTDQDLYADPLNWKYPVHTPQHAAAAAKYFARPSNRARYSIEEQEYVEGRIQAALARFARTATARPRRPRPRPVEEPQLSLAEASKLTGPELLAQLLDPGRLQRARAIPEAEVRIHEDGRGGWEGTVGAYRVVIDTQRRVLTHDCEDWRRRLPANRLCKHLGRVFMMLPPATAETILREILEGRWSSG